MIVLSTITYEPCSCIQNWLQALKIKKLARYTSKVGTAVVEVSKRENGFADRPWNTSNLTQGNETAGRGL